jgi:hypothetical protein
MSETNLSHPPPSSTASPSSAASLASGRDVQVVLNALRGLRFGSVEIIVQDSRIVQIDRLEKRRLV